LDCLLAKVPFYLVLIFKFYVNLAVPTDFSFSRSLSRSSSEGERNLTGKFFLTFAQNRFGLLSI